MLPDRLVLLQTVQGTPALQIWILQPDLSYLPSFFLAWAMVHFLRTKLSSLWSILLPTQSIFSDFRHIFLLVLILVGYTECVQTSPWEQQRAKEPLSPQSDVLAHLPSVVVVPPDQPKFFSTHAHTPDKLCKILMFSEYLQVPHWTLMSFLQIFTEGGKEFPPTKICTGACVSLLHTGIQSLNAPVHLESCPEE